MIEEDKEKEENKQKTASLISIPQKYMNPYYHYKLGSDIFVNEEALLSEKFEESQSIFNTFKKPINCLYKKHEYMIIQFENKIYYDQPPIEYFIDRLKSFIDEEYQQIAKNLEIINKFYQTINQQQQQTYLNNYNYLKDIPDIEKYLFENKDRLLFAYGATQSIFGMQINLICINSKMMQYLGYDEEWLQLFILNNGFINIFTSLNYKEKIKTNLDRIANLIVHRQQLPIQQKIMDVEVIFADGQSAKAQETMQYVKFPNSLLIVVNILEKKVDLPSKEQIADLNNWNFFKRKPKNIKKQVQQQIDEQQQKIIYQVIDNNLSKMQQYNSEKVCKVRKILNKDDYGVINKKAFNQIEVIFNKKKFK